MSEQGASDNPKTSMRIPRLSRCLPWVAAAVLAGSCQAAVQGQVMQAPGTMPDGRQVPVPMTRPEGIAKPPAAITNQPGTPSQPGDTPIHIGAVTKPPANATPSPAPNLPPSLLDKPAQPAHVTLNGGSLAVDANNSSLSQILNDLASSSGMAVDGLGKDQRVFGKYGPGNPRDILSELLDGAGYNFLMVGATETGTPREIVLTTRNNAPLSSPQNGGPAQPEEDDEPIGNANNYPAEQDNPASRPAGLPPQAQPNGQPRSPAEIMQDLQRLRQQQQQQQQQPAPQ